MAGIGFIMAPMESLTYYKDTSYHLMHGASQLGYKVYHLEQDDLFVRDEKLYANASLVEFDEGNPPSYNKHDAGELKLDDLAIIWVRIDPPFDRRYFYTTLLLDTLKTAQVVNSPRGLREWNEKLAILKFGEWIPQTQVTSDPQKVQSFVDRCEHAVLKPLDGFGGRGIEFVRSDDSQSGNKIMRVTHNGSRQIMCQKYIPQAIQGDKRVLVLDAEPLGAVLRVHAKGQELNNLDAGGSAHFSELSERELNICKEVGERAYLSGIRFLGIDLIGEMLMEINVTSPTCLRELTEFTQRPLHREVIARLMNRQA